MGPLLVRVEAEDHELRRGVVHEFLHGGVEQLPRWVDPHLSATPTGRFKIGVEGENLVKPRLVEVKLGLQPVDVRVLEEVGVQTDDRRVGVNRAEERVRLENAGSTCRVDHVHR